MGKVSNHNLWRKTINEFYACNGTIKLSDFCKEKNITKSQFHYFKKKLGINKETIIFHSVSLNEDKNIIDIFNNKGVNGRMLKVPRLIN